MKQYYRHSRRTGQAGESVFDWDTGVSLLGDNELTVYGFALNPECISPSGAKQLLIFNYPSQEGTC